MEQPQRKTWTMKHPALAKAYAVVFAVMSLILLFGGVTGIEKAEEENAERLRYENRYAERIENYVNLCEKLENSITYDEVWAELEKRIEEHDEDASQHRTDLAMHTAEKGGYTMGANAIYEAKPQIEAAKRELAIGKAQLAESEKQMQQVRAGWNTAQGDTLLQTASAGATACATAISELNGLVAAIDAFPGEPGEEVEKFDEPKPELTPPPEVTPPVEPTDPGEAPTEPSEPTNPGEPGDAPPTPGPEPAEDASEEEKQAYNDAVNAQNAYNNAVADYNKYLADYAQYQLDIVAYPELADKYAKDLAKYNSDLAQYTADLEEYNTVTLPAYKDALDDYNDYCAALEKWKEYKAYSDRKTAYDNWNTNCQASLGLLEKHGYTYGMQNAIMGKIGYGAEAVIAGFQQMLGGAGSAGASMPTPGASTVNTIYDAQRAQAVALIDQLNPLYSQFSAYAADLAAISGVIAAGEKQIADAKTKLAVGEEELKKAEHELQHNLEMIWYELGELEKENAEFAENKQLLDEEASVLSKEIVEADALHELENDRTSAKLLLTSVKEVNDMVEAGGEIVPSAEKHLESYKAQTELQYKGRMLSCALAIVGGVMGVLAIPAAYELIRKRFMLIVPAVVCVVCAAAAEGVYYGVGLGWWYVGMFTAIIGLIHLLIVIPKEKHPSAT